MDAADERGFRDFVSARSPALMRLGFLLTGGDQHAAEDLVQAALAKLAPRQRTVLVLTSGTAGRAGTEPQGSKACGDPVRPPPVALAGEAGSRRSAA
ncbi:hypothetical protein [Thermoactinospora rubra]|uniref:hypothetical protein n=1 Tax=Thermoactinospora rubra TaxID=1088767 RepID=UPI00197E8541|nr:hypothetical protein [Thermoactinospora rubra]